MIQQQGRQIQSLIISAPQEKYKLTAKKLKAIHYTNGYESLEDIMNSLQQLSFLANQIKQKYKDLSQLSSRLIDFVNKSQCVDLLINGDYIIQREQQILIFSAFRILFCPKRPNKNIFQGIQYKIGKSYYHGQFQIGSNDIVYSNGELFVLKVDKQRKLCERYEGLWSEGSIIEGTKQIFEYKQLNMGEIVKEKAQEEYKGEFKNMKYEGKGTLIKKSILDKGKKIKIEGIFKNGNLEKKQTQQLI